MNSEDWKELVERFREHFGERKVSQEEDVIEFDGGSSSFKVTREGEVEASMPLHSFSTGSFESVSFQDDCVKVFCDEVEYEFRK
ncbi:MAG: hypothetical protein ABEJ56_01550 [Candidatus Nanohaloarchaea archaeon]